MNGVERAVTVAVVEDHPITLAGLEAVISGAPHFRVVGTATTGAGAIALFRRTEPDLLLLDLMLPDIGGVEVVAAIRTDHPSARIVVLTSSTGSELIHRALEAGARAYLLKSSTPAQILGALQDVHAGRRVIPKEVAEELDHRPPADLTDRELDVLRRLVSGGSNKDIAAALGVGETTVRTHISHILMKLGVNDRAAAVSAALRSGLVSQR